MRRHGAGEEIRRGRSSGGKLAAMTLNDTNVQSHDPEGHPNTKRQSQ